MKKFVYLLMMLLMLCGLSMNAQNYGKPYRPQRNGQPRVTGVYQHMPSVEMRSTSTFGSSGSTLPQAAVTGTYTADELNAPARIGPRRVGEGGGFADGDDDNPDDKDQDPPEDPGDNVPAGSPVLPLLLMSLAFCGVVYMRKRKAQA